MTRSPHPAPWFALVTVVAALSCGSPTPIVTRTDDGGEASSSSSSGDADPSIATTAHRDPESSSDEGPDPPPNGFIMDPDGFSNPFECDYLAQDCAPGRKCTIWATDGGSAWNGTRCVPIVPHPDQPGEPCTVEGSPTSGLDTCDLGGFCWNVDDDLQGECVLFCTGDGSNPVCPDPAMRCVGRDILLCLPTCCPIDNDCGDNQLCVPDSHFFLCAPDASGDAGAYGDPCEFINVCDSGLVCLGAASIPDCLGSAGCCTAFCDVGSESCALLDPALACVPWFDEGFAPPGLEHVGVCVLPG